MWATLGRPRIVVPTHLSSITLLPPLPAPSCPGSSHRQLSPFTGHAVISPTSMPLEIGPAWVTLLFSARKTTPRSLRTQSKCYFLQEVRPDPPRGLSPALTLCEHITLFGLLRSLSPLTDCVLAGSPSPSHLVLSVRSTEEVLKQDLSTDRKNGPVF